MFGDIKTISNFELNINKPLDSRLVVNAYSDLSSITHKYNGLLVYVSTDQKHYFWNQVLNDWDVISVDLIDDLNSSLTTTYSSDKINELLSSISGADGNIQTYMLSSSNSSAGTNFMISIDEFIIDTITTNTINVSTTPTKLFSFITESGFPNITLIPYGQFVLNFETEKASGSAEYYTYAEIYKVNVSNVKTLISTTANSTSVTVNTNIIQNVGAFINTTISLDVTDRLQVDIYAVVSSSNADITIKYDDNTNARFVIPTVQITKTYVDSQLDLKQDVLDGTGYVISNAGIISYDDSTYLTENEEITISGEAYGTGNTAITLTLDNNAVISKLLDLDLNLVGDLDVNDTINDAISKLNNKLFELSVADFQLLGVFEKNATYKISDADINLYGGTEIYLTTNHEGILDEYGLGKFYNPFYQTYNIYNLGTSYAINQVVIWGGFTWLKTSASNSNPTNIFTLSNFWTKEPNSVNNLTYDKIKYDYLNDLIIYREDNKGNKVSFDKFYLDDLLFNPIKYFQWGSDKITAQILINSINENINFSGDYQKNIYMLNSRSLNTTLKFGAYQENLTLINSFQDYIILRDGGSQSNLTLNNSSQSSFEIHSGSTQQNLNLNDSTQNYFTIYNSGSQSNLNLNNSVQNFFTIQTCTQNNIYMFGSSQTDFILSFIDQLNIYFNNYNRVNPTILSLEENLEFKGDLTTITTLNSTTDKIYVKQDNQVKEITLTDLTTLIGSGGGGGSSITLTTIGSSGPSTLISNVLNIPIYQSQITGTGFVKSNLGVISYDTNTYITANQNITLSGAITGTGNTTIVTTLVDNIVGNDKLSQMASKTIKANITGLTANVSDITFDSFNQSVINYQNITISGIVSNLNTSNTSYIRFDSTSQTGLKSVISDYSGKIVNILNSTNQTLTIYNEDLGETSTNRISCNKNLSWSNNQVLTLQYNSTIERWIVNNLSGSTYFPSLSGTSDRMIQTDNFGQSSAIHDVVSSDFNDIVAVTGAVYTNGLAVISGTFAGQYYFDQTSNFMYTCHVDDNVNKIKIDDYLDINSIQVFGNLNISTDSNLFINSQHTSSKSTQTIFSLPTTSSIGDLIFISSGIGGLGGFRINQIANQQILGLATNSTLGATGYISSTSNVYSISLKCIEPNLKWIVTAISPSTIITVV